MGVRTYDPPPSLPTRSDPAAYGTVGTEFQLNRFALPVEGRDQRTRFKGLSGHDKGSTRNQIALSAGLAWVGGPGWSRTSGARLTKSPSRAGGANIHDHPSTPCTRNCAMEAIACSLDA